MTTAGLLEKGGLGGVPEIVLWDTNTWEVKKVLASNRGGRWVAFSPDGKTLAVGGNEIALWRVADLLPGGK